MLSDLTPCSPDPILNAMTAFREDRAPQKIDLSVGIYRDPMGETPIFSAVKQSEQELLLTEKSKSYLGIEGNNDFNHLLARLALGDEYEKLDGRVSLLQSVGGSGALRVAAELIKSAHPQSRVFVSDPTWANHYPLIGGAGLNLGTYPYLDASGLKFDAPRMLDFLNGLPPDSAVVLQSSCHNPTGVDPTPEEWRQIASVLARRKLVPIIDLAYQGLGDGEREDATAVRLMAAELPEFFVTISCSKNFGLYRERTGLLIAVAASTKEAKAVSSHVHRIARSLYSMPPNHGAAIVARILSSAPLKTLWQDELDGMRRSLRDLREILAASLSEVGFDGAQIKSGKGMFTHIPMSDDVVGRLRAEQHIYLGPGGRLNLAGLSSKPATAIAALIVKALKAGPI